MSLGLKKGLPGQKEGGSLEHNRAVVFVRGANKINKKPINPYPRSLWLFAPGGRQHVTCFFYYFFFKESPSLLFNFYGVVFIKNNKYD